MNLEWGNYFYYNPHSSIGMFGYDSKKIVKNPINERYIAGGSSSGSAAAV